MNTHPPVAEGVICIDFDKTLWEWGDLGCEDSVPMKGAVEAVRKLRDAGYRIVVLTSRMSKTWWVDEAPRRGMSTIAFMEWQQRAVIDALRRVGIPFDRVTAEKVPALYYIDDRAIEFTGDWDEIVRRLIPEEAA